MLHPLPTQHPRERKTYLSGVPSLHLDVSPSLDTLSSHPFFHCVYTQPSPSSPKLPFHRGPQPQLSPLGVSHAWAEEHLEPPALTTPVCMSTQVHIAPGLGGRPVGASLTSVPGPYLSIAAQIFRPSSR